MLKKCALQNKIILNAFFGQYCLCKGLGVKTNAVRIQHNKPMLLCYNPDRCEQCEDVSLQILLVESTKLDGSPHFKVCLLFTFLNDTTIIPVLSISIS